MLMVGPLFLLGLYSAFMAGLICLGAQSDASVSPCEQTAKGRDWSDGLLLTGLTVAHSSGADT